MARDEGIAAALVILYADSPKLPFPAWLASGGFQHFCDSLRRDRIVCRAVSYQMFIQHALAAVASGEPGRTWGELGAWIDGKIAGAAGSQL
jgi:hypothetical protein